MSNPRSDHTIHVSVWCPFSVMNDGHRKTYALIENNSPKEVSTYPRIRLMANAFYLDSCCEIAIPLTISR